MVIKNMACDGLVRKLRDHIERVVSGQEWEGAD